MSQQPWTQVSDVCMFIYVCMCACVHTCMCLRGVCVCVHACVCLCVYMHVYVFMRVCMCARVCACMHECVCVCVCVKTEGKVQKYSDCVGFMWELKLRLRHHFFSKTPYRRWGLLPLFNDGRPLALKDWSRLLGFTWNLCWPDRKAFYLPRTSLDK